MIVVLLAALALGVGFVGFTMQDIEIITDETGAPQAFLARGAQARLARLGALTVLVTITSRTLASCTSDLKAGI